MRTLSERFWAKVSKGDGDACWAWTGARDHADYGSIKVDGKRVGSHRVAWTLECGPIPDGIGVLHKCDVPSCVRPSHLFLGTHQENMGDRNAKRRQATGADHGRAKLDDDAVREIRAAAAQGESRRNIAKRFGVAHPVISRIVWRQTWSHVA